MLSLSPTEESKKKTADVASCCLGKYQRQRSKCLVSYSKRINWSFIDDRSLFRNHATLNGGPYHRIYMALFLLYCYFSASRFLDLWQKRNRPYDWHNLVCIQTVFYCFFFLHFKWIISPIWKNIFSFCSYYGWFYADKKQKIRIQWKELSDIEKWLNKRVLFSVCEAFCFDFAMHQQWGYDEES